MGQVNGKYVLEQKDIKWFAENTELSEEDVRLRYDHFVQNYPDGKIPKDAFIAMLEGAYSSSKRMSKIQAHGLENYAFKTYDLNGDGCIDFKEFFGKERFVGAAKRNHGQGALVLLLLVVDNVVNNSFKSFFILVLGKLPFS